MKRFFAATLILNSIVAAALPCLAAEPDAAPHCAHEQFPAAEALSTESVYQLDSRWTRADGSAATLAELRGKVRVMAIFFASCTSACPVIVSKMKAVRNALPANQRDRVGFVLVSMDPERDTPEQLRAYAEKMDLEGDWTLLHGSDGDVRELAAVLGFRYRKEKDGGFSHSNMITVLNAQGEIAHQTIGLESDPTETIKAVAALLP